MAEQVFSTTSIQSNQEEVKLINALGDKIALEISQYKEQPTLRFPFFETPKQQNFMFDKQQNQKQAWLQGKQCLENQIKNTLQEKESPKKLTFSQKIKKNQNIHISNPLKNSTFNSMPVTPRMKKKRIQLSQINFKDMIEDNNKRLNRSIKLKKLSDNMNYSYSKEKAAHKYLRKINENSVDLDLYQEFDNQLQKKNFQEQLDQTYTNFSGLSTQEPTPLTSNKHSLADLKYQPKDMRRKQMFLNNTKKRLLIDYSPQLNEESQLDLLSKKSQYKKQCRITKSHNNKTLTDLLKKFSTPQHKDFNQRQQNKNKYDYSIFKNSQLFYDNIKDNLSLIIKKQYQD